MGMNVNVLQTHEPAALKIKGDQPDLPNTGACVPSQEPFTVEKRDLATDVVDKRVDKIAVRPAQRRFNFLPQLPHRLPIGYIFHKFKMQFLLRESAFYSAQI